ncbi:MAG: T9SS type A sorting domain-containing protein [Flavipsychrobacter sp.]
MKRRIITICLIMVATLRSVGQSLVPPSPPGADVFWVPGGSVGINTALIDIWDPNSDSKNYPLRQLGACAYYGGGSGVILTDFRTGFQVNIPYPGASGYGMTSVPDVILGNKSGSNTDFIMAVAFVNNATPAQIEVDYYDIHYPTPAAFTVVFHSYQIIPVPFGLPLLGTVHMDVVAQSSIPVPITSGTSLPFCDPFFVTFDAGTSYRVVATYGRLNAYNAALAGPQVIVQSCPGSGPESWQPDVAGIERVVSGSFHNIACLTYVCQNYGYLIYSEWDPSLSGCSGLSLPTYLDGTGGVMITFAHPRIDANDDYFTNSGIACQSKVVCEVNGRTASQEVDIYAPTAIGMSASTSSWINLSSIGGTAGPYNHYAPAVAYGQDFRSEYMVTECTEASTGDYFIMSPIDQSCGGGLSYAPGSTTVQDYFEVNSAYPAASAGHANAVSTPCNFVTDTSLVAWTNGGGIFYKRSGYGGTAGYAYKANPSSGSDIQARDKLTIFPNPATGLMTVDNTNNIAGRYIIKNILGQEMMSGILIAGKQQINIDKITAGSYLICFYNENKLIDNKMFVKK